MLWTMVLFFGASLMFAWIKNATDGDGIGTSLAAQAVAGVLLVVLIALWMKQRG